MECILKADPNEDPKQPKPRVPLGALADLGTFDVIVEVDLPTGEIGEMRMKTLTYAQWLRLGAEIPDAVPPASGFDAKKMQPTYNYADPTYQAQQAEVIMRRSFRRLLAALTFEIPGDTIDAQIDTLIDVVDTGIAQKLFHVLSINAGEGEARVMGRAATFHGNGSAGPSRVPRAASRRK